MLKKSQFIDCLEFRDDHLALVMKKHLQPSYHFTFPVTPSKKA